MSLIQKTGLIETLEPIFSQINYKNWDQCIGEISKDELFDNSELTLGTKCCIGVHIAIALTSPYLDGSYDHRKGVDYIMNQIKKVYPEMTETMVFALFHCAGAPMFPFGLMSWILNPSEVLERIKYIETMPPCSVGRKGFFYYMPEVKDWLQLERDRIEICIKQKELVTV